MKKAFALLLVLVLMLSLAGCDSADYKKAVELYDAGNYQEAAVLFTELGDYKDSEEKRKNCNYEMAAAAYAEGDFQEAMDLFRELDDYKDSAEKLQACYDAVNYESAEAAYAEGDFKKAVKLYKKLGEYRDSAEKLKECYIAIHGEEIYNLISPLDVGDTVEFGTFEQDYSRETTNEKITWYVIDKQGDSLLLLSEKILAYMRYHDDYTVGRHFKWEQSTNFEWLNVSFYASAFTEAEQKLIRLENPSCMANVFLLSNEEAAKLPRSILEAKSTKYALATNSVIMDGVPGYWALRTIIDVESPTIGGKHYLTVNKYGDPPLGFRVREEENEYDIGDDGLNCDNPRFTAIRPAIWISLDG